MNRVACGLRNRGAYGTLRRLALCALVGAVLLTPSAVALVGPPPLHEPGTLDVGVEVSSGERDVVMQGTLGGATMSRTVLNAAQTTTGVRLGYAISPSFHARALVGAGWMNLGTIDWRSGALSWGSQDMDGDAGLLWGLGADYVVWPLASAPDVRVGVSAEYRSYTSGISRGGELEIDEIRAALKMAWPMDRITLYGGPLYSDLDGSFSGTSSSGVAFQGKLDADDKAGVLVGAEFQFNPRLVGRLEGEFISSTAINLSFIYGLGGPVGRTMERPREAPPVSAAASEPIRPAPSAGEMDAPPPPRRRPGVEPAAPAPPEPAAGSSPATDRRTKPPTPPPGTRPRGDEDGRVETASDRREAVNVDGILSSANEMAELGRYDEAIVLYRRAVAANPGEFRAVYNLATSQYLSRDYAGAQASYESAIALRPDDAEAHLFLGFCHYRQRRPEAAARAWRRVLELDPSNAIALNNLQALGY